MVNGAGRGLKGFILTSSTKNSMEYIAKLTPTIKKMILSTCYDARTRWHDPFNSKYYTVLRIYIPCPRHREDNICILVSLHNAKTSLLIRFRDVFDLSDWFNVSTDVKEALEQGLAEARQILYIHKKIEELADIEISKIPERKID